MPIFYVPDNTPSRNYGRNSDASGYAHPAHGIIGGLAKSATDPRNRGRRRSSEEIEASSHALYAQKKERLAKLKEEVERQKEIERAQKEVERSKRLRATADKSAAALAANPEAARQEVARQQTAEAASAKRGQPVTRLTKEEIAANEKAINARERAAVQAEQQEKRNRSATMDKLMSERMKPEGPSLSDVLASSEAVGKKFIDRPRSTYTPPATPAAATPSPAAPAAVNSAVKPVFAEPHKFRTRTEFMEAAMNPSGAPTPVARMQGQNSPDVDRTIAGMNRDPQYLDETSNVQETWNPNSWAEATHPNWKPEDLMRPDQLEAVKNQDKNLRFWASPTAETDWRDVPQRGAKDNRVKSLRVIPSYVKDNIDAPNQTGPAGKQAPSENNRLISNAFSAPGTVSPSAVYSPEQQQRNLFAQRYMLAKDNPAVADLPNRIADQLGETLHGLTTKGFSYFNSDPGDERGSSVGDMIDATTGAASDAGGAIEKYLDENGLLIDPRKNAIPRPIQFNEVPQIGAAPLNPLEDFVRRMQRMQAPEKRRNAGGTRSFVR